MKPDSLPILIVGGGIGGMTCALALALEGYQSRVLEQAAYFRETGAGILLCPNVFKVFDRLQIMPKMEEIASFPEALVWSDALSGQELVHIPMGNEVRKRFGYPYGSFHREELLRELIRACEQSPLVTLQAASKAVEVGENGERVFAITENGQKIEGAALIGADGLWSSVRRYVLDGTPPRFSNHITHRGVVSLDKLSKNVPPNRVIHWDRPGAHLVQYPIGTKGLYNIVAVYETENACSGYDQTGHPEELQKNFSGSRPEVLELVSHVDTSRCWMMYDREPGKVWTKGRMTLLGDAAHPTLPHLTQGAGMAIEDALVLAKMVARHHGKYKEAFEAYQNARYLRTAHVQIFSRAYGEVHHLDGIARELKNQLLSKRTVEENYEWLAPIYKGIDI